MRRIRCLCEMLRVLARICVCRSIAIDGSGNVQVDGLGHIADGLRHTYEWKRHSERA